VGALHDDHEADDNCGHYDERRDLWEQARPAAL
jgi:hypothetical protein